MGLAAPPGEVIQCEIASGPASPPATDLRTRQANGRADFAVTAVRELLKEQGQAGPLDEAVWCGPTADYVAGTL